MASVPKTINSFLKDHLDALKGADLGTVICLDPSLCQSANIDLTKKDNKISLFRTGGRYQNDNGDTEFNKAWDAMDAKKYSSWDPRGWMMFNYNARTTRNTFLLNLFDKLDGTKNKEIDLQSASTQLTVQKGKLKQFVLRELDNAIKEEDEALEEELKREKSTRLPHQTDDYFKNKSKEYKAALTDLRKEIDSMKEE